MTYQEFYKEIEDEFSGVKVNGMNEHLAYQFNVTGDAQGIFYVEIKDGVVNTAPYEYYDRDVIFTASADTFKKIMSGKKDPVVAFTTGKLKVDGSIDVALKLKDVIACIEKK